MQRKFSWFFFVTFSKGVLLPSKTSPFTLQKESFCLPKRVLLHIKRSPFAAPPDLVSDYR